MLSPIRPSVGIHNAAAVPTSAEIWTFPAFSGPKTLHVTLFSVAWPCSYATLRHVNWTSFIIIIIIIIIIMCNFYHTAVPSLYFYGVSSSRNSNGFPERGRQTREGWENKPLSSLKRQYLENGKDTFKVTTND